HGGGIVGRARAIERPPQPALVDRVGGAFVVHARLTPWRNGTPPAPPKAQAVPQSRPRPARHSPVPRRCSAARKADDHVRCPGFRWSAASHRRILSSLPP